MYIGVRSLFLTGAIVFALVSIPIRHYLRQSVSACGITQFKSNEAIVLVKKLNEDVVLFKIKTGEAVVLAKNKSSEAVVFAKNKTNEGIICAC